MKIPHDTYIIHPPVTWAWFVAKLRLATPLDPFIIPAFRAGIQALLEKALQGEALGPRHFPERYFFALRLRFQTGGAEEVFGEQVFGVTGVSPVLRKSPRKGGLVEV